MAALLCYDFIAWLTSEHGTHKHVQYMHVKGICSTCEVACNYTGLHKVIIMVSSTTPVRASQLLTLGDKQQSQREGASKEVGREGERERGGGRET